MAWRSECNVAFDSVINHDMLLFERSKSRLLLYWNATLNQLMLFSVNPSDLLPSQGAPPARIMNDTVCYCSGPPGRGEREEGG
jgi:hypothetical protein